MNEKHGFRARLTDLLFLLNLFLDGIFPNILIMKIRFSSDLGSQLLISGSSFQCRINKELPLRLNQISAAYMLERMICGSLYSYERKPSDQHIESLFKTNKFTQLQSMKAFFSALLIWLLYLVSKVYFDKELQHPATGNGFQIKRKTILQKLSFQVPVQRLISWTSDSLFMQSILVAIPNCLP